MSAPTNETQPTGTWRVYAHSYEGDRQNHYPTSRKAAYEAAKCLHATGYAVLVYSPAGCIVKSRVASERW